MNNKSLSRPKLHGFRAKKSMGQNFLTDKNIKYKILRSIEIGREDTVIEIGPGFGSMSFDLYKMCKKFYMVEKDETICSVLAPRISDMSGAELICANFLDKDISELICEGQKAIIYGNIPYNITTSIMKKIIDQRKYLKKVYLVIQKEYADRIAASPGSKDYGSLTCFLQFYAQVQKKFIIGKNSFNPAPKVDSGLVAIKILDEPSVAVKDEDVLFGVIRKAFSQRRKKILNTLSHGDYLGMNKEAWRRVCEKAKVDPGVRPEDVSLEQYARISDLV